MSEFFSNLSIQGNISGTSLIGDGSNLDFSNLTTPIGTTQNISAGIFYGDGSSLSNISTYDNTYVGLVGDGNKNIIKVNHNLNSMDLFCNVIDVNTGEFADVETLFAIESQGETTYTGTGYIDADDTTPLVAGDQTFAVEIYLTSLGVSRFIFDTVSGSPFGGFLVNITSGNQIKIIMYDNGSVVAGGEFTNSTTLTTGQWYQLVVTYNATTGYFRSEIVGGNAAQSPSTRVGGFVSIRDNFNIGSNNGGSNFVGKIRNIEVYEGVATDPQTWIPGDTTSLGNTTLVFQSKDGSGTDNEQGVNFNITSGPVIKPAQVITNDCINGYTLNRDVTFLDGVDDYSYSNDSTIMFSGQQTWCIEASLDNIDDWQHIIDTRTGDTGFLLQNNDGQREIYFTVGSGSGVSIGEYHPNQVHKFVISIDTGTTKVFVDGIEKVSYSRTYNAPSQVNIGIHNDLSSAKTSGFVRNLTVYSGNTSKAGQWSPNNPDSLDDVTLVMYSPNGIGTDNEQGVSFTAVGSPNVTTQMEYICSNISYISGGVDKEYIAGKTTITDATKPILDFGRKNDYHGSFYFDGADYFTDTYDLETATPLTVSCWVKRDNTINKHTIISDVNNSASGHNKGTTLEFRGNDIYWIRSNDNGLTRYRTRKDISSIVDMTSWFHVAAIGDGTGYGKIYVNGVELTGMTNDTGTITLASGRSTKIGVFHDSEYMQGNIEDLRIHKKELEASQILQLYHDKVDDYNNVYLRFTNTPSVEQYAVNILSVQEYVAKKVKAYIAAGYDDNNLSVSDIQQVEFSSNVTSTIHGNLDTINRLHTGTSSNTQGYTAGGYNGSSYISDMSRFTFSSPVKTFDHGDLITNMGIAGGASYGNIKGFQAGGYNGSNLNYIQSYDFSSNVTTSDLANLSQSIRYTGSCYSDTQGFTMGGGTSVYISNIYKYDFVSTTNSVGHGNLGYTVSNAEGCQSSTHGFSAGGSVFGGGLFNNINKMDFVSNTTASDHGDLNASRTGGVTSSNDTSGLYMGGSNGTLSDSSIQKFDFSSNTIASDHGDLSVPIRSASGHQG